MAEKFSTGFVNAEANAIKTALANCVIGLFSGTQPTSSDDAEGAGSLLCLLTLASGAFTPGNATNGLNFDGPTNGVLSKPSGDTWSGNGLAAAGAGTTATWFRVYPNGYTTGASTTAVRWDGAISKSSTAELQMTNTTIVQNVPVSVTSFSLTLKKTA